MGLIIACVAKKNDVWHKMSRCNNIVILNRAHFVVHQDRQHDIFVNVNKGLKL